MARRLLALALVLVCATGVIAYQVTRPAAAPADPDVFVPSPEFYLDLSPGFRTSIADAYYLSMVQYYGEHVKTDGRLDALPAMARLVTTLSPHFTKGYMFGAFALLDAGEPGVAYEILKRGFAENPDDWHFPAHLGFFVYSFASNENRAELAAEWYAKAAEIPGRPDYIPRLAAALLAKGGEREKAVLMWGQVFADGDKYSRQKAVDGLERVLPSGREARMRLLAPLRQVVSEADFATLVDLLMDGGEW